jgi:hypothetical protein
LLPAILQQLGPLIPFKDAVMRKRIWLAVAIGLALSGMALSAKERQSPPKSLESLERVSLARQIYQELEIEAAKDAAVDIDRLVLWSKNWLAAEVDFKAHPEHVVKASQDHLARTEKLALFAAQRVKPGEDRPLESKAARFYILEARAQLEQAKLEQAHSQVERRRMQLLHGER